VIDVQRARAQHQLFSRGEKDFFERPAYFLGQTRGKEDRAMAAKRKAAAKKTSAKKTAKKTAKKR
jgi:topoisomerase IA-like protein